MRPTRFVLGLAALPLLLPSAVMAAQIPPGYHLTAKTQLARGVTYQQLSSGLPERVHVVTIAPSAQVTPLVVLSNDQVAEPKTSSRLELTSQACRRTSCVAGVNGDYFCAEGHCPEDQFEPEGGVIADGRMLRSPDSVGWQEQQLMFNQSGCPIAPQQLKWAGSVISFDLHQALTINGVNVDRGANQLILYTAAYGPRTLTNEYGSELVLQLQDPHWLGDLGQAVKATPVRFRASRGNAVIQPGTVVLSAHGIKEAALTKFWQNNRSQTVNLRLDTYPTVWNSLGAKPLLVQNGHYTGQWFQGSPMPVTIVAWKADCTRFLITADGRQPSSRGLNTQQEASLAISLGATTAYGLDNGGSTTLVGRGGRVFNHPSDVANGHRVQRLVANSLMFVPSARQTRMAAILPERPVVVGQGRMVINLGGVGHLPGALVEQLTTSTKSQPGRLTSGLAIGLVFLVAGMLVTDWRHRRLA